MLVLGRCYVVAEAVPMTPSPLPQGEGGIAGKQCFPSRWVRVIAPGHGFMNFKMALLDPYGASTSSVKLPGIMLGR